MATSDDVVRRLDPLIDAAKGLAGRAGRRGDNDRDFYAELSGWRAQSITAIASIVGEQHPYYAAFQKDVPSGFNYAPSHGAAILSALRADVEAGYLQRQETLIVASVFTDFLEMAGHLLESGYFQPAASLIGGVIEDGLRRIAIASGVKVTAKDDINSLSSKLRDKGVFNPLVAKRVTLWAEVRNNVDHGQFEKVTIADVQEMYRGVTAFLAEQLS